MRNQSDVLVVGGGISGLVVAWCLQKAGRTVKLIERESRVGGNIKTISEDDFIWEAGPSSLQVRHHSVWKLVNDLGLMNEVSWPLLKRSKRYLVRNNRLYPVAGNPLQVLFSPAFSWLVKLRCFAEPFVAPGSDALETVSSFFTRRFGREVTEYLVDPVVRGIYAGDPTTLVMSSAFPRLAMLEKSKGSVLRGLLTRADQTRRTAFSSENKNNYIFTFRNGLETLTRSLEQVLKSNILCNAKIEKITSHAGSNYKVQLSTGGRSEILSAAHVVLAVPAFECGCLLEGLDPHVSSKLKGISYPPLKIVLSVFNRDQVPHALDGYGYLTPACEKRYSLGSYFSSSTYAGRAPSGSVALTAMVGGSSNPERAVASESEVTAGVLNDYRQLLNIDVKPKLLRCFYYQRTIPQYDLNQILASQAVAEFEEKFPGLHITGNFLKGVGIGSCVEQGVLLAEQLIGSPNSYKQAANG